MSQPATPNPQEVFNKNVEKVRSDLNSIQSDVRLTSIRDELEDIDQLMISLPNRLKDVRTQGYVFEKGMESSIAALRPQWERMRPGIVIKTNQTAVELDADLRSIEPIMLQLSARSGNMSSGKPYLAQVETAVSGLRSRVDASKNSIHGMFDAFQENARKIQQRLTQIEQILKLFNAASFKLLATEGAISAVKAVWAPNGKEDKDDPEGILYLTDQRVLFEQNEEIATKKFLFITTESEKVKKMLFEFPVAQIEEVVPSKLGLFKNEDHLDLQLSSGAPYPNCHLHLDGQDCNLWQQMIRRIQTREYDQDRTIPIPSEVLEKIKNAPTQCPKCGASMNKPILRGQEFFHCDFCGNDTRL